MSRENRYKKVISDYLTSLSDKGIKVQELETYYRINGVLDINKVNPKNKFKYYKGNPSYTYPSFEMMLNAIDSFLFQHGKLNNYSLVRKEDAAPKKKEKISKNQVIKTPVLKKESITCGMTYPEFQKMLQEKRLKGELPNLKKAQKV